MAQGLHGQAGFLAADASGGDEEIAGAVEFAGRGFDLELSFDLSDFGRPAMCSPTHTQLAGGTGEAVDDGL